MYKVPFDLRHEILKFEKSETYIMNKLSCNEFDFNIATNYKIKSLKKTYFSKTHKLLKWFFSNKFMYSMNMFLWCVKYGNLKSMKWLKKKKYSLPKEAFSYTSWKEGNLKILKWLKKNGFNWTNTTFNASAQNGNLKNMKWLLKHGCPFKYDTLAYAAQFGNLKNMKWLVKKECPISYNALSYAAGFGNLKNMKWLIKQDCLFDNHEYLNVKKGDLKTVKWLKLNNCPWSINMMKIIASWGDRKLLLWLSKNGCEFDSSKSNKYLDLKKYDSSRKWLSKKLHKRTC
jgi:hypothetical protein